MQEFLALNTDARIAFVKKPFIVSRIDKVCALVFHCGRTQSSLQKGFKWVDHKREMQKFGIFVLRLW